MRPLIYPATRRIAWLALCLPLVAGANEADDAVAIRATMMATWDKPESHLVVDPVVVSGTDAIASWAQGDHGGRALLKQTAPGHWSVVLCAGDAVKDVQVLEQAGLSPATAQALTGKLAKAEAHLSAPALALFASFEGVVNMKANSLPHAQGQ